MITAKEARELMTPPFSRVEKMIKKSCELGLSYVIIDITEDEYDMYGIELIHELINSGFKCHYDWNHDEIEISW